MPNARTPQSWTARLHSAAATLARNPSTPGVFEAMTLLWQTARAAGTSTSPAAALSWMRLVESLDDTWDDLADLAEAPGLVRFETGAAEPSGVLEDAPPLHVAVGHLLTAAAAAVRQLAEEAGRHHADAALALAIIAATLDEATRDWP